MGATTCTVVIVLLIPVQPPVPGTVHLPVPLPMSLLASLL